MRSFHTHDYAHPQLLDLQAKVDICEIWEIKILGRQIILVRAIFFTEMMSYSPAPFVQIGFFIRHENMVRFEGLVYTREKKKQRSVS